MRIARGLSEIFPKTFWSLFFLDTLYFVSLLVIERSSHTWMMDWYQFRTSVIWTWSNQTKSGTEYTPALDCYMLTFWHCIRGEVWFVWNKQKQHCKCYTWTKSGPKMFRDWTDAMLDRRGPGPGPRTVLILKFSVSDLVVGTNHAPAALCTYRPYSMVSINIQSVDQFLQLRNSLHIV